jgi:hypothetical protein
VQSADQNKGRPKTVSVKITFTFYSLLNAVTAAEDADKISNGPPGFSSTIETLA